MSGFEGGCLCGAVRYRAKGEPLNQRVCHCRLCQKAIGAAFNARALFSVDAVVVEGPVARAASSPDVERGFCPACGTTIFSARLSLATLGITSGSLDDPAIFRPAMHIWTTSRQLWVSLDDGLAQYPEAAPA